MLPFDDKSLMPEILWSSTHFQHCFNFMLVSTFFRIGCLSMILNFSNCMEIIVKFQVFNSKMTLNRTKRKYVLKAHFKMKFHLLSKIDRFRWLWWEHHFRVLWMEVMILRLFDTSVIKANTHLIPTIQSSPHLSTDSHPCL